MNNILLTIAIPTYNRSAFLTRNLEYLFLQKQYLEQVEIIVSDNASVDDTETVVEEFIKNGLVIKYIKNEVNKGADFNIIQCYKEAKGIYILTMGDDDALLNGALQSIIEIIGKHDKIGSIFLNSVDIDNANNTKYEKINYFTFNNIEEYLKNVTYFVTFISANIINREALENIDFDKWSDSLLVQVPVILNAIKIKGASNVVVYTEILAIQTENSGGYNIFKVFGQNFNNILQDVFSDDDMYRKIIINDLFIRFFPFWVLRLKKSTFFLNLSSREIINLIDYNLYFWIFTYPILILPRPFDNAFYFCIRAFGYFRRRILVKNNYSK